MRIKIPKKETIVIIAANKNAQNLLQNLINLNEIKLHGNSN